MFSKRKFLSLVLLGLLFLAVGSESFADVAEQLEQAQNHMDAGQYDEAESIYLSVVRDYAGTDYGFEAQSKLPILYSFSKKYTDVDTAVDTFIADYAEHSDFPQSLFAVAERYRDSKRYENSRNLYQRIVQQHPNSVSKPQSEVRFAEANVLSLIVSKKYADADNALEQVITDFSARPDFAELLYGIAGRCRLVREFQEAHKAFEKVVQYCPDTRLAERATVDLCGLDIILLIRTGRYGEAETATNKLVEDFGQRKNVPCVLNYIVQEYKMADRFEYANNVYSLLIESVPSKRVCGQCTV